MLHCAADDQGENSPDYGSDMTDDTLTTGKLARSAFLPADTSGDKHIVDVLIEERCPSFAGHWTWPVVRPLLYSLLGYKTARTMADDLKRMSGVESFDHLADTLDFRITTHHLSRVPKTGRCVVIANHPTGLADGVAVWQALTAVRRDVVFFANADAMRVNPRFGDAMIPVEWVLEKRSPAKTRETLKLAGEAFAEGKCIVIFPSGKLAKMIDGKLTEQDWFPTAVGLARKQKAPIVPLNVDALNSRLYYFFAKLNGELRDITLFHELLNKKRSKFEMTCGPVIDAAALEGENVEITRLLRDYVAYEVQHAPDKSFIV